MDFMKSDFNIKLLSVQKLKWDRNDTYVMPREYNALSFRVLGNADFSDGEKETHISSGEILFMPENVGYFIKTGEEELIVVHFELEGEKQNYFEVISPKYINTYKNLFQAMYDEWNNREQGYYYRTLSLFYSLLARLEVQIYSDVSPQYSKIRPAIDYINKNFSDPDLNVPSLCELLHMSDTYFRRLFMEVFGTTPVKYINKLRIDYAAELLDTGYYSLEYISRKCGFSDPKYFATVFKMHKKCPPSEYRH